MKKSKKQERSNYVGLGKGFRKPTEPKEERKMINRKAIQTEIDIDKKIRALIEKDAYNLNQIAGMLMVPLERVKTVRYGK
tara:strand:- start:15 stop:254 length:240 start_codon:yes stop_codon:yes gene_type:complete